MDAAPPAAPAFAAQVSASPESARRGVPGRRSALFSGRGALLPRSCPRPGCPLPRSARGALREGGRGRGGAPALLETHLWGAPAGAGSLLCKGWRGAGEGGEVGVGSAAGLMRGRKGEREKSPAPKRGCQGEQADGQPCLWRAASRGRLGGRAGLSALPPRSPARHSASPFPAGWMPRRVRPASCTLPWQPGPGRGSAGAAGV